MRVELDDPARADVRALLEEHLRSMHALSPPESVHALDVSRLRGPGITFWTVRAGDLLLGCGALKELDPQHGEVKSMRTPQSLRRRGAGRAILAHIIEEARRRGYTRLSLETGAAEAFLPAQRLYASFGFSFCGPFADYKPDPNSVFMSLVLMKEAAPDYVLVTGHENVDVRAVHAFLQSAYWSPGVPFDVVERAVRNSLCFGVHLEGRQVAFARVVTDKSTFAYLADVYVLEGHRGRGLSKRMLDAVFAHPDLQGLRRFLLATRDAHSLYAGYGFTPLANPSRMMEIHDPHVYANRSAEG